MLNTDIVLSSAGSLSVAVIALFFFIFQGWIYLKGSAFSWSKWGAGLSLATSIYAVKVFIQFNAPPNFINHVVDLLQYSTFIILVHCVYGFTFAYLEIRPRRLHQVAGIFHVILLVILWTTKFVITDNFTYRSFIWLKGPYIEPELGILGHFFILYSALAAAL